MSKAIRASALVLLLTCSAQAGWIQNDSPAPPPSQPATAVGPTTDGQIDTGATAPTADGQIETPAAATFVEVLLNLLALS
ncbi:MAG TPA: hypothetical protein VFS10_06520 [Pyrinomonadaceae bacterium]|nr:hypothetical protein [Pyrinomonadaceae bacterium]